MLGISRKKFWQGSDSNPEPTAWEPCCPKPTAVIYFWIKRVGNFGLKKKEKRPYWMNNFSCILHILRKIITSLLRGFKLVVRPCSSGELVFLFIRYNYLFLIIMVWIFFKKIQNQSPELPQNNKVTLQGDCAEDYEDEEVRNLQSYRGGVSVFDDILDWIEKLVGLLFKPVWTTRCLIIGPIHIYLPQKDTEKIVTYCSW